MLILLLRTQVIILFRSIPLCLSINLDSLYLALELNLVLLLPIRTSSFQHSFVMILVLMDTIPILLSFVRNVLRLVLHVTRVKQIAHLVTYLSNMFYLITTVPFAKSATISIMTLPLLIAKYALLVAPPAKIILTVLRVILLLNSS